MNSIVGNSLEQAAHTSECFMEFVDIARKMPEKIREGGNSIFEGENEVITVLDSFKLIGIISEEEYYNFLDQPFEVSIYRLLKRLYFDGYFSGNINIVDEVKDILTELGKVVESPEVGEIQEYFRIRAEALIEKERKYLLPHLVRNILDSILYATLREDQKNVWEMMSIANMYDTTGFIRNLFGQSRRLGVVTHECLHFLYINGFLHQDENLQERTYITLMDFYALSINPEEVRVNELQEHRKNIIGSNINTDTSALFSEENIIQHQEKIRGVVMRECQSLHQKIRFGEYSKSTEKGFKRFLGFLLGEQVINQSDYDLYAGNIESLSSPFSLFFQLYEKGFFNNTSDFEKQLLQSCFINQELYEHEIEEYEQQRMLHVFDENMSEYVKNLMTVIYNGDPKEIKEYLQMVFDFLEESNIEVPDDILDEQNLDEQTYSLFSFLIVGNYIEDQTIKAQVLELTLSYYNAHNPKHEQELLEFSFTQDR